MIKFLLIPLSVVFVFAGAVNDGPTGYVLSLPFFVILLYYIFSIPQKWIKYSLSIVLAISILFYYSLPRNPIIYPQLGQELVLYKDIKIFSFSKDSCTYFQPTYLDEEFLEETPLNDDFFTTCIPKIKTLFKGSKFYATEVRTAHPDFGKKYIVKFSNNNDFFYLDEENFLEVSENLTDWHYLKVSSAQKISYLLYYPLFILKIKDWLTN